MIKTKFWHDNLQYIISSDDQQKNQNIICITQRNNSEPQLERMSKVAFDNFYKEHSSWNSRCYRLSLSDIVTMTECALTNSRFDLGGVSSCFNSDHRFDSFLLTYADLMCQRSVKKWESGRVQTQWKNLSLKGIIQKVWRECKWLYFKYLLDQTPKITNLKNKFFLVGYNSEIISDPSYKRFLDKK